VPNWSSKIPKFSSYRLDNAAPARGKLATIFERDMVRGWEDSNFRIRRRAGGANQALVLRRCANRKPIFLAETTGLPLPTERQCRHIDAGLLASSRIPPRWRYRHCGASVVTARAPSQTERISKMSHRNTPSKTTVAPAKHAKKSAKLEKAASGSTRGGTKQRSSGCSNSPREQRSPQS
jgi:hypothetical protein